MMRLHYFHNTAENQYDAEHFSLHLRKWYRTQGQHVAFYQKAKVNVGPVLKYRTGSSPQDILTCSFSRQRRIPQCLDHRPGLLVELSVIILLKHGRLLRLLRVIQLPQQNGRI